MYAKKELETMDLETAKVEFGNGHHIRQQITKFGTDLLEEIWNEQNKIK